jgi:hypothetical protein
MKLRILDSALEDLEHGRLFYERQGEGLGAGLRWTAFREIDLLVSSLGIISGSAGFQVTTSSIFILALVVGIAVCGLFFVGLFRREPRKALNIVVLTIGIALLTYGHLQWMVRRESPSIKEAMFIRHVIAGWAMTGIGFVGLQLGGDRLKRDE